jgi:hypothetical protein
MGKDVMPLTFELVDLKFDFACELFVEISQHDEL